MISVFDQHPANNTVDIFSSLRFQISPNKDKMCPFYSHFLFIGNDGLLPREDKLVRQSMILEELFWSYWDQKLKLISACNHQRETSGDGTARQVINAETDTTMHLAYAPGIATCSELRLPISNFRKYN